MNQTKIGFAMCGSFCTFSKALRQIRHLVDLGNDVTVIMSPVSYTTDTRFGRAEDFIREIEEITGHPIIHTIEASEPIGPKKMFDILVVLPCTGNTVGKLANGITDTAVTMAVKSHLRNKRPVVIGVSTNDALGSSARNIGILLNLKNIYFIPMCQDDPVKKPNSVVADFEQTADALSEALEGKQLQPIYCPEYRTTEE